MLRMRAVSLLLLPVLACLSVSVSRAEPAAPEARAAAAHVRDSLPTSTEGTMYNFQINRVASEARAQLAGLVTNSLATAPKEEHAQIKLAGQTLHYALTGIDDEHLVEAQAYGSNVPSTGQRTFFVNVTTRQIKTPATDTAAATAAPWDPTQGPLGAVTTPATPGSVDAATAATSASSPANNPTGEARAG